MNQDTEELPLGWERASIESIAQTATGGTPSRKQSSYYGGSIPWVKSGDLNDGLIVETSETITTEGLANSNAKIFPKGAVCVALYGATVGKLGILEINAATNQAVCGVFPEGGIESKFVFYSLRNERGNLISQAQGGAQPNISNGIVKETILRIPPLNEQRRIVAKIEALQERSRKAREALAEVGPLLEQFRQSLLAAAFRGDLTTDWRAANPSVEPASELLTRIRQERRQKWEQTELAKFEAKGKRPPKGWEEKYDSIKKKAVRATVADVRADGVALDEVPIGWELVRLGDIANLQAGYAFQSKWFSKTGVRLLRGTNIEPGNTRWTDTVYLSAEQATEYDEYQLNTGDVVIAMDRPVISTGLKVARINQFDLPALLLQRVGRFQMEDRIAPDFIYLFVQSPFFMRHIDVQSTGTQLPHISANDIESAILPLPPLEEQAVIISRLTTALDAAQQLEAIRVISEHDLGQLDQSILAKAFRGELVTQDPDDEPASVLLERIREDRERQLKKKSITKTANKRPVMHQNAGEKLKEWLSNADKEPFTFDDLRRDISGDYDELKDAVYALLDQTTEVEQIFDESSGAMCFRRLVK